MLQFPTSLLSSAALIEGSIEAIVAFHESDLESRVGRELTEDENETLEEKAASAFADIIEDIKDIMHINAVSVLSQPCHPSAHLPHVIG